MPQFRGIKYQVYINSVDWITIKIGKEYWTWFEGGSSGPSHWYIQTEPEYRWKSRPLLPGHECEGWTLKKIIKMMDEYGWMFIDPLSRKHEGEQRIDIYIPKEKS